MVAIKKGLRKLEADCMETQTGMMQVLQPLGFEREGTLKNFVVDMRGREHDLILLGIKDPKTGWRPGRTNANRGSARTALRKAGRT